MTGNNPREDRSSIDWARVSAVLFDAVGTLFQSSRSIGGIYSSVAAEHGVEADVGLLERSFATRIRTHGSPIDKAGWEALVRSVFEPFAFPDFERFLEDVYRFFESGRSWRCYPETVDVLSALAARGYRLGVVSNFDRRLGRVLGELGIGDFFSAVVIPETAGHAKPDPRIFLEAAVLLDTAPGSTLVVGDDPALDVGSAHSAGMQAVLVDHEARVHGAIRNLGELLPSLSGPPASRPAQP
jgi:putative hydrolase of the HAD superfamily